MFAIRAFVLTALLCSYVNAGDWPQFRGPTGQGHADARRLPLAWSEDSDNIAWKAEIDGKGWSSPAVYGERIWLTTAVDEGRSLRAICLGAADDKIVHNVEIFQREEPGRIHAKNSHASPTCWIDQSGIYVHFGTYGTAKLSHAGEVLWRRQIDYRHVHGPGGSPVVVDDRLIFSCDGGKEQFVCALDCATGEVVWRTPRPENAYQKKFAFCTPLAIEVAGQTQVVSPGAGGVSAYDPATGREIWRVDYPEGYSVVPRPVFGHGLLFVCTGFDRPGVLAIRPDGNGDVTESHVAWSRTKGAPLDPSPLLVGDELYLVSDRGVASCLDARTGEVYWTQRIGGNFSASPVYGAGRIYLLDEQGKTTVIAPGTEFKKLAENQLPGRTLASLAVVEGALLLRTDTHLYRIDAE